LLNVFVTLAKNARFCTPAAATLSGFVDALLVVLSMTVSIAVDVMEAVALGSWLGCLANDLVGDQFG
jgi:hypothetical protein